MAIFPVEPFAVTNRWAIFKGPPRELQLRERNVAVIPYYAEGVGEFQPRVALWQPWVKEHLEFKNATLSGLRLVILECGFPGLPRLNPGLEFANAFSVKNKGGGVQKKLVFRKRRTALGLPGILYPACTTHHRKGLK